MWTGGRRLLQIDKVRRKVQENERNTNRRLTVEIVEFEFRSGTVPHNSV